MAEEKLERIGKIILELSLACFAKGNVDKLPVESIEPDYTNAMTKILAILYGEDGPVI